MIILSRLPGKGEVVFQYGDFVSTFNAIRGLRTYINNMVTFEDIYMAAQASGSIITQPPVLTNLANQPSFEIDSGEKNTLLSKIDDILDRLENLAEVK